MWELLDTDIQVQAIGDLDVTEVLTLRYSGGPFTFAYRDLPSNDLDGITNIRVLSGEQNYRQVQDEESEEPGTFAVFREDDSLRVRWVYAPTTDADRSFTLRYSVEGAVAQGENADEVWWPVVFPARKEPVQNARGRIALPAPVPPAQMEVQMPNVQGAVEESPGVVTLNAQNIAPRDRLIVIGPAFRTDVVNAPDPAGRLRSETRTSTTRPSGPSWTCFRPRGGWAAGTRGVSTGSLVAALSRPSSGGGRARRAARAARRCTARSGRAIALQRPWRERADGYL